MKEKKRKKPDPTAPILGPIIAANLVRIRGEEDDLTQAALANRAGVTQPTVSKIERGDGCSLEMIEHLAQAMGRHPCELFKPLRKGKKS